MEAMPFRRENEEILREIELNDASIQCREDWIVGDA